MWLRSWINELPVFERPALSVGAICKFVGLSMLFVLTCCARSPVIPPAPPSAILSANTIGFPTTVVGATATSTLSLSNGGGVTLALSKYLLSDTADFSLTTTCGADLAAAASCTFSILFRPQTAGVFNATLTLTDDDGGSGGVQQVVTLTGTGAPVPVPQAIVAPSSLTFPLTITNSMAPAQTVTLTNSGTAPLAISDVMITGPNASAFSLSNSGCNQTLAANSSCTEAVTYDPQLARKGDSASLTFVDDAGNQQGSTQTVSLTGSALAEVDSVTNFGDSITCGFYAQPNDGTDYVYSLEGYAGLFDKFVGAPATNRCRQDDEAADLSRLFVPFYSSPSATGNQLYTVMIGTNNAYRNGSADVSLNNYVRELGAALAWLALPSSDKVLASSITQRTGTWSNDVGFGLASSDGGASLTFHVNQAVANRNLYVVYHVYYVPYGQAGTASISVDGVAQASVDESENSGFGPPTPNGTFDTYFLQIVPLGAVGTHTVTFSSTGPAGSVVSLLWAGVPQGNYAMVDGAPRVLVGAITNSPSSNQTYTAGVYNARLRSFISSLAADGMNIVVVPTDTVLDPNTDFVDLLHPNNAGHAKLAAAFENFR